MGAAALPIMAGATVLSTYMAVQGSRANVAAMKRAAQAEAQRADIAAKNAGAVASVQQAEVGRKVGLTLSRARALAAASGTAIPEEFFGAIAERGEEQKQLIGWQARTGADSMQDRAALAGWQAEAQGRIARSTQIATVLGGAAQLGGLAYKYGGPAPGGAPGGSPLDFDIDRPYGATGALGGRL